MSTRSSIATRTRWARAPGACPQRNAAWARVLPVMNGTYPGMTHAGCYAATMHYLEAVAAMGAAKAKADGAATVATMKNMPTDNDAFGPGRIREDGRAMLPAYLLEVKTPAESKMPWDYSRSSPPCRRRRPSSPSIRWAARLSRADPWPGSVAHWLELAAPISRLPWTGQRLHPGHSHYDGDIDYSWDSLDLWSCPRSIALVGGNSSALRRRASFGDIRRSPLKIRARPPPSVR